MSFKTSLGRFLREALADDRPTPNQGSTTPTTTPSTNGTPPSTSQEPSVPSPEATTLATMMTTTLATIKEMQATHERETRELVISILQGRPMDPTMVTPPDPEAIAAQKALDMPNYDDDSMPLPGGIQAVLAREEDEAEQLRLLLTEQARLEQQLAEAQSRLMSDPQGPTASTPS